MSPKGRPPVATPPSPPLPVIPSGRLGEHGVSGEWTAMSDAPEGAEPRTVADLVAESAEQLTAAGVTTAKQEARDLVAACVDEPRFWPTQHASTMLPAPVVAAVQRAVRQRAAGAPFAYAVGHAPFRHLTLQVDARVLIPRPETESLVDEVLQRTGGGHGVLADVGTGSGALALALAAEGGFARVIATDVSQDCLDVAGANAATLAGELRARVEFRHGASLAPLQGERLDVLVSNPPYIAFDEARDLPASVRNWEPATALFAADEGMAIIAEIVRGAPSLLVPGGLLALEVDSRRGERVVALAEAEGSYSEVALVQDLTGRDRFVFAVRG